MRSFFVIIGTFQNDHRRTKQQQKEGTDLQQQYKFIRETTTQPRLWRGSVCFCSYSSVLTEAACDGDGDHEVSCDDDAIHQQHRSGPNDEPAVIRIRIITMAQQQQSTSVHGLLLRLGGLATRLESCEWLIFISPEVCVCSNTTQQQPQ